MHVLPYLQFDGRCEEAIEFYKTAIGATVEQLMRFKDAPDQSMMSPGSENKVMHACLSIGDTKVMASDGDCHGKPSFQGFALTLMTPSAAEAERLFQALEAGGAVRLPLTETFFSPRFGMLADRFGVSWMILATPEASAKAAA
jgi:PhnB protein